MKENRRKGKREGRRERESEKEKGEKKEREREIFFFREVCVFINNQVNKKQSKLFEVSIIAKQDRYGTHDVANG